MKYLATVKWVLDVNEETGKVVDSFKLDSIIEKIDDTSTRNSLLIDMKSISLN